ncbi:MAG: hypothetical protein GX444_06035 [Myxococcales bacterium]|nr:hypothetical protein [Myxococcales bacterium]
MDEKLSLYQEGHLIVAAVRLLTHREKTPPAPEQVAEFLGFSIESVHYLVNKLDELGALRVMSGAYGVKLLLDDHRKLEELEGVENKPGIEEEIAAFQAAQAQRNEEMAKRFSRDFVDPQKESLKADLAAKIADPSKLKRADNPLDAMFKKKG